MYKYIAHHVDSDTIKVLHSPSIHKLASLLLAGLDVYRYLSPASCYVGCSLAVDEEKSAEVNRPWYLIVIERDDNVPAIVRQAHDA